MNLEDDLRRVLRSTPPDEGFDRRVLARLTAPAVPEPQTTLTRAVSAGRIILLAAAIAIVTLGLGTIVLLRTQPSPARHAAAEVQRALAIASDKLVVVQRHVARASSRHTETGDVQ